MNKKTIGKTVLSRSVSPSEDFNEANIRIYFVACVRRLSIDNVIFYISLQL